MLGALTITGKAHIALAAKLRQRGLFGFGGDVLLIRIHQGHGRRLDHVVQPILQQDLASFCEVLAKRRQHPADDGLEFLITPAAKKMGSRHLK